MWEVTVDKDKCMATRNVWMFAQWMFSRWLMARPTR